jgi:hypothetical protein
MNFFFRPPPEPVTARQLELWPCDCIGIRQLTIAPDLPSPPPPPPPRPKKGPGRWDQPFTPATDHHSDDSTEGYWWNRF